MTHSRHRYTRVSCSRETQAHESDTPDANHSIPWACATCAKKKKKKKSCIVFIRRCIVRVFFARHMRGFSSAQDASVKLHRQTWHHGIFIRQVTDPEQYRSKEEGIYYGQYGRIWRRSKKTPCFTSPVRDGTGVLVSWSSHLQQMGSVSLRFTEKKKGGGGIQMLS